jgi:hypothetical protein
MLVGSRNPEHEETATKSVGEDARAPSSSDLTNQGSIAAAAERIRNTPAGRIVNVSRNVGSLTWNSNATTRTLFSRIRPL